MFKRSRPFLLQQLLNGITFSYCVIAVIKVQVIWTNGTPGHLDTAFNEFDLALRSEVHLHGVDKLRPPDTDPYNQHCTNADKNHQFDLI